MIAAALTAPRIIGRCSRSDCRRPVVGALPEDGQPIIRCECGGFAYCRFVSARVTDTKCGARCTGAVGPACDCECGGENHGAAHSV